MIKLTKKNHKLAKYMMVIELSGVQFGLKSIAWLQYCDLLSQVWFQSKIASHEVQFPLYSFWNIKHFCKPETFLFAKDSPPVAKKMNVVLLNYILYTFKILENCYRNEDIYKE
jgi:hypothetical protein